MIPLRPAEAILNFISLRAAKNTCVQESGWVGVGGWSVADSRATFSSVLSFRALEETEDSQSTSTSVKQEEMNHFLLPCVLLPFG